MKSSAAVQFKFERIEKKFWMSRQKYKSLLPVLEANTIEDIHDNPLICNIYYDTDDYALIRKSIERPFFKEKLRFRCYGIPEDDRNVFIELKRKLDGIGYKRRLLVPYKQAKVLLQGNEIGSDNPQIEREILNFVSRYHPKPKIFLTYERRAMRGREDTDLRITIDEDLRYKLYTSDADFQDSGRHIMELPSQVLMEIKTLGAIPPWLLKPMNKLRIYQAPFSKIGKCYADHIAPNTIDSENK